MEGNPICVQVDWDDNPEYVKAWKEVFNLASVSQTLKYSNDSSLIFTVVPFG